MKLYWENSLAKGCDYFVKEKKLTIKFGRLIMSKTDKVLYLNFGEIFKNSRNVM